MLLSSRLTRTLLTMLLGLMVQAASAAPLQYRQGNVQAEANLNPVTRRLLGRVLQQDVPSRVSFSATDLAGQVTLPSRQIALVDGLMTLDAAPLRTALQPSLERAWKQMVKSHGLPNDLSLEQLEAIFRYDLVGEGVLTVVDEAVEPNRGNRQSLSEVEPDSKLPKELKTTSFVFEYGDRTQTLKAKGLDPKILATCQIQTCTLAVDGSFDIDLDLEALLETSETLQINLPGSAKRLLRNALFLGLDTFDFAAGTLLSDVTTQGMQPTANLYPLRLSTSRSSTSQRSEPSRPQPSRSNHPPFQSSLSQGTITVHAQRPTVPWSLVFSIP